MTRWTLLTGQDVEKLFLVWTCLSKKKHIDRKKNMLFRMKACISINQVEGSTSTDTLDSQSARALKWRSLLWDLKHWCTHTIRLKSRWISKSFWRRKAATKDKLLREWTTKNSIKLCPTSMRTSQRNQRSLKSLILEKEPSKPISIKTLVPWGATRSMEGDTLTSPEAASFWVNLSYLPSNF